MLRQHLTNNIDQYAKSFDENTNLKELWLNFYCIVTTRGRTSLALQWISRMIEEASQLKTIHRTIKICVLHFLAIFRSSFLSGENINSRLITRSSRCESAMKVIGARAHKVAGTIAKLYHNWGSYLENESYKFGWFYKYFFFIV